MLLAPAGAMAQQSSARQACGADIKEMCAEVKPGGGRLKACVKEHFGQLSATCQTALISNVTITKSCKADAETKMRRHSTRRRAHPNLHEGQFHGIDRALQGSAVARQAPEGIASRGPMTAAPSSCSSAVPNAWDSSARRSRLAFAISPRAIEGQRRVPRSLASTMPHGIDCEGATLPS